MNCRGTKSYDAEYQRIKAKRGGIVVKGVNGWESGSRDSQAIV